MNASWKWLRTFFAAGHVHPEQVFACLFVEDYLASKVRASRKAFGIGLGLGIGLGRASGGCVCSAVLGVTAGHFSVV